MNIFHWLSEAYADYARGHIIVLAETVQEARALAIAEFIAIRGNTHYRDPEDWENELSIFVKDVEPEPTEHVIMFISGSA